MDGEIITIGGEFTSGRALAEGAAYAAKEIAAAGLRVGRITAVTEDRDAVSRVLDSAMRESRVVIVLGDHVPSGEPGPRRPWVPPEASLLGPAGADQAFAVAKGDIRIYFLPKDRTKLPGLLGGYVLTELRKGYRPFPAPEQRVLKLYGLEEDQIAAKIEDLGRGTDDISVKLYPAHPAYHLCICSTQPAEGTVNKDLARIEQEIRARLRPFIFAAGNQTMAGVLGERLREESLTLSVAESCTGGLIGHLLTEVPGSSQYFMGGVVVYSNQAKVDVLQVAKDTIDTHGAVSAATVRQMAEGVKGRLRTDIGLAVTGIAGPTGGTAEKPVGTVHIGLALRRKTHCERYRFQGSREQIKSSAAMMALDWVRRVLNGHPFIPGV